MESYSWPYANEAGEEEIITSDVLVLGGLLCGDCCGEKGTVRHGGGEGSDGEKWFSRDRL